MSSLIRNTQEKNKKKEGEKAILAREVKKTYDKFGGIAYSLAMFCHNHSTYKVFKLELTIINPSNMMLNYPP